MNCRRRLTEPTLVGITHPMKRHVPFHLWHAIRAYRQLAPFRGHVCATLTLPISLSCVAASRQGAIFVSDPYNHCIRVCLTSGSLLHQWGSRGKKVNQFQFPTGIAVTPSGDEVVVADCLNHRVQVFQSNGKFLRTWGSYGSGDGQFREPRGVAVTKAGEVVVADGGNHRIQVFRLSDGTFLRAWGRWGSREGQLDTPVAVHVTQSNDIVVVDYNNVRIQVFRLDGTFVQQWRTPEWSYIQALRGVTVRGNEVLVIGLLIKDIQVFQLDGTLVRTLTSQPADDTGHEFGLATMHSGHVLVCGYAQTEVLE